MGRVMPKPASFVMPGPGSSGPNPLEALGSGRLTGGVGPGPKVPTQVTDTENLNLSKHELIHDNSPSPENSD